MKARLLLAGFLVVLFVLPAFAFYGEKSLLFENFESISPPALPAGWATLNPDGDTGQWQTRSYGGVKWGKQCIRYFSDPVTPAEDWFFTSGVSLTAGGPCNFKFMSETSWATRPLFLEVWAGTSQVPGSMTTIVVLGHWVSWDSFTEEIGSFAPPIAGIYFIGFHVTGPSASGRVQIDDVNVTIPETDLRLAIGMTKEIELVPLVYSSSDSIQSCIYIENIGTSGTVINKRFSVGKWPSDVELDVRVTGPTGLLPCINMFAKMGDLKASHFAALDPDSTAGKVLNLWSWYRFDTPGAYTIEAHYRNYADPGALGAWKGELVSDPVLITIQ
ncbi:MAG: hypothetical protein V1694_13290 [Candidatus Eisenbacteria bacterium]